MSGDARPSEDLIDPRNFANRFATVSLSIALFRFVMINELIIYKVTFDYVEHLKMHTPADHLPTVHS